MSWLKEKKTEEKAFFFFAYFNVIITSHKGRLLKIFLFVVCKIMWSECIHFKLISLLCQLIQVHVIIRNDWGCFFCFVLSK